MTAKPRAVASTDPLWTEVQHVLDRVAECFRNNDFDAARALWDTSDPAPFYVAEEHEPCAADWPALEDYWRITSGINKGFTGGWTLVALKQLSDDDVLAMFRLTWTLDLEGYDKPLGGFNRGMAGLRRVGGDWKLHAYMEAPLAPLVYMKKLYEVQGAANRESGS